jgi:hypothetical protein
MKKNEPKVQSTIELFGNIDENFYQLGLRDREEGKKVLTSVKGMLKTPFNPINKLIEEVGKTIIKNTHLKENKRYPHLFAYAEGLNLPLEELFYSMLIPEIVSGMTKWAPGIVRGNLGCSSYFMRNENNHLVHGRILDFPLQGTYDLHERTILYALDGMPKIFAYNTVGIPYPSITCMTENGMTVALHQKFTNILNTSGESIFEIIFELLKKVNSKEEAIEFLKTKKSLTTWCLYLGFKNGDILAYDLMGEENFYNELHLESNSKEVIYFCNHLENKQLTQENFLPLGFDAYNCMRENTAQLKIKDFKKLDKYTDGDLLKMMATPSKVALNKNSKIYQMDSITPTSILATTLNTGEAKSMHITGAAPKIYRNNLEEIENTFNAPIAKHINDKKYKKQNEEYYLGLHALTEAQKGFDDKDPQIIYHELQFAIDHLENYNEQVIAKFYFLIAQYLYENHKKIQFHLLTEFKNILPKLEGYLSQQCLLFIFRLELILDLPLTLELDLITNTRLKDIVDLEQKIPRAIFHLTNKLMIVPRIDILDIIYVYTH